MASLSTKSAISPPAPPLPASPLHSSYSPRPTHAAVSASASDPLGLLSSITEYYASGPTLASLTDIRNPHLPVGSLPRSTPNPHPSPLRFTVHSTCPTTCGRASTLTLPHASTPTPLFMPVGTQATLKGLTSHQTSALSSHLILSNTYHLSLRPGPDTVAALGGLHRFMAWPHNLLTDSGGFQMVSLLSLATITEEGVRFLSPFDSSPSLLTPEASIHIQNLLGADIIMALDDVVSTVDTTQTRFEEATHRTIRWIDRCIRAHSRPHHQALFGIIQGGVDSTLREACLRRMLKRDAWLPGYAIGGLAGGESKDAFWRVILQCCEALPKDKPRYAMGVGYPLDLLVCVALGVDMFDCVWPCRTARFGSAIVPTGIVNLRRAAHQNSHVPIDLTCTCLTCMRYTRAMLAPMAGKTALGCHLLTIHNLHYMKQHMDDIRSALMTGTFPQHVRRWLQVRYPEGDGRVPRWVKEALTAVGLELGQWGISGPGLEVGKGDDKGEEKAEEEKVGADGEVMLVKEVMEEDAEVMVEEKKVTGKKRARDKRDVVEES